MKSGLSLRRLCYLQVGWTRQSEPQSIASSRSLMSTLLPSLTAWVKLSQRPSSLPPSRAASCRSWQMLRG